MVECPKCGDKVPINGPQLRPVCDNCSYEMTVKVDYWKDPMETLDDCHNELAPGEIYAMSYMGSGSRMKYGPQVPLCNECNTPLPVDTIRPGHSGQIQCTSCGAKTPTYPPPQWLVQMIPSCRQIYGGEPDSDQPGGAVAPEGPQKAQKPVAMSCPQCGAGLSFTSADERLVPCKFCGADVYLPDAIWRRLHPVKRSQRWYVRFEGEPQKKREREQDRQRRQQAAIREQDRAIMAAAAQTPKKKRSSHSTWEWVMLILMVVGFPAVFFFAFHWCRHDVQKKNRAALKSPSNNPVLKNKIKGTFHAKDSRVGTWTLNPNKCTSGQHKGFFGVYLSAKGEKPWVKVVKDPASGKLVVTVPFLAPGQDSNYGVVLKNCKVLEGNVARTNTRVNRTWMVQGRIKVDCALKHKDGPNGRVWGEVDFAQCYY